MFQPTDDSKRKRGRKPTHDDELHRAWRVAAQYNYAKKKAKREL